MKKFDIIFTKSKSAKDLAQRRKFGWKRDLYDPRDIKFKVTNTTY